MEQSYFEESVQGVWYNVVRITASRGAFHVWLNQGNACSVWTYICSCCLVVSLNVRFEVLKRGAKGAYIHIYLLYIFSKHIYVYIFFLHVIIIRLYSYNYYMYEVYNGFLTSLDVLGDWASRTVELLQRDLMRQY